MEEPTFFEGIFITIWFFWTIFAFHYHGRHRSYLEMCYKKVEDLTQITDKWAKYEANKMEDLEYYNTIKSQFQLWSSEGKEHGLTKEDILTFFWYGVAFFLGGAGLYTLVEKIWRNLPFS